MLILQYRSEIDGLRALAIIPVVFFHGGFSLVSGGFVGVDVFFVISGYLITLLLYQDISSGSFSVKKFYERRIKRLFPALFLVTSVCAVVAWFLYWPFDLEDFYGNLASVYNFSSNIHFYIHSGYFDPSAELNALLHTWSLAVEEQFYFVFPWFLLLVFKLGKKAIWFGVFSLIIVSFTLAEWRLQTKPMAAFYLLYARGWELMIGSLCALIVSDSQLISRVPKTYRELLAWLGLCLILYSIFFFTAATPAGGRYTLIPTLGAALIILFARSDGSLAKLLSHRLLVSIGLISYSTYLWHQPLLAFTRYYMIENFDLTIAAALCLASFALGYISWRFVEKPFRYGAFGWNTSRRIYISFTILALAIFMFAVYGEEHKGFPERLEGELASIYQTPTNNEKINTCFLSSIEKFKLPDCLEHKSDRKNALIIGDSHAGSLYPSLREAFENRGWTLSIMAYTRCVPMISDTDLKKYRSRSTFLSKHITPRCEKIKESFDDILEYEFDQVIVLNHYNNWMGNFKQHNFDEFWSMYIETLIEKFTKEKLLVLGDLPIWVDDLPKLIMQDYSHGKDYKSPSFKGLFSKENLLDQIIAKDLKRRGIRFLSSREALCSDTGCLRTGILEDNKVLATSYDYGHLSQLGANILSDYIMSSGLTFSQPNSD